MGRISLAGAHDIPEDVVVFGVQDKTIDADDDRGARFERNTDHPSGVVVDYLRWGQSTDAGWFQVSAWDARQDDERIVMRAGLGPALRFRASYQGLPYRYGDGARTVLGMDGRDAYGAAFRIGDFIQRDLEDPDRDGVPFYSSSGEGAEDDAIVNSRINQLLDGSDRFSLSSRRRAGTVGVSLRPGEGWNLDLDLAHELRDGRQSLGSGTYARITDVNGDGTTDYDYFFSIRGIELAAPIDYRTTRFDGSIGYGNEVGFFKLRTSISDFDNSNAAVTYDHPFWFDGVNATSGSRRGLWDMGRVSLEPSNSAWNFGADVGFVLAGHTRLTASGSFGRYSQDEPFLPITTNRAVVGTADINRDGVVDGDDNPLLTPAGINGLPSSIDGTPVIGSSLGGEADTTSLNFTLVSRPAKGLTLTGKIRSYDYEGTEPIQVIPARTEYNESRVKLDFKGDLILHVPHDYARRTFSGEIAYRLNNGLKLKGFIKRKAYDYKLYTDPDGNSTRDSGTRAVKGTDDDIFGVSAALRGNEWLSGSVQYQHSDRAIDGDDYVPGFSGENSLVRQYDIAERKRDQFNIKLDLTPSDETSISLGYSYAEDDYDMTEYGLQKGKNQGFDAYFNYAVDEGVNLFAWLDRSEWDADMHLRTKCANCSGFDAWEVPNYDWFSGYTDQTLALGGGVALDLGGKTKLELTANYVDGQIEQTTRNPAQPTDLNPDNPLFGSPSGVATGFDFPNQENTLVSTELKLTHRVNDTVSVGLWWLFEDYKLDDFQWNNLEPYGANFLTVDDATRYLFLDSRYTDYTAHVVQGFMTIKLGH